MRVGILSHGTRGDVQPFVALALELRARGHHVAVCGPCSTADLVRSYGIEAHSLTFDARKMISGDAMQAAMQTGDGNACVIAAVEETKRQMAEGAHSPEEANAFLAAYRPDVVGHPSLMSFIVLAETHGVPVVNALFMPFLPSRSSHPCFQTLAAITAQGMLDKPLDVHRALYDAFMDDAVMADLNALREKWGLPLYRSPSEVHAAFQAIPTANCWSASVVPQPADLDAEFPLARQTGYIFADEPHYEPPPELAAFLGASAQDRPVYVGFGSLSAGDPRAVTEKVLRALIAAGRRRCVMLGGWSGIGPEHLDPQLTEGYAELKQFADESVLKVESAPHSWLLPRCGAAIHHGGAGTTGAVARAGISSAIAPFAWDQPYWAERVEALGVGVALPTMITNLGVEELGRAIARVVGDGAMAERAAALGARIRGERGGAAQLADFVEEAVAAPVAWPTKARPAGTPFPPPLWERAAPALKAAGAAGGPPAARERAPVQGGA